MKIYKFIWIAAAAGMLMETSCSLDKGVAIQSALMQENRQRLDFYGRVIDQYGQPVVGAKVQGNVLLNVNFVRSKEEVYFTKTDSEGQFKFIDLHGVQLGVMPTKEGYQMGERGEGWQGPHGSKTSPTDRAIMTMWKLKGPEPMIHRQKFYGITPDWRIFTIDLEKHQKIEGANDLGDFTIQIQRPSHIEPQERFDWSFVMTAIGGGFIEVTNNGYLNEAPESGYHPQYKFDMSAAEENENWKKYAYSRYVGVEKTFYIKSRNGKDYGHFSIKISPNYNDTSAFNIEYYINPSGSRNLEWDGRIQIE